MGPAGEWCGVSEWSMSTGVWVEYIVQLTMLRVAVLTAGLWYDCKYLFYMYLCL